MAIKFEETPEGTTEYLVGFDNSGMMTSEKTGSFLKKTEIREGAGLSVTQNGGNIVVSVDDDYVDKIESIDDLKALAFKDKVSISDINTAGSAPTAGNFLRGDGTWQIPEIDAAGYLKANEGEANSIYYVEASLSPDNEVLIKDSYIRDELTKAKLALKAPRLPMGFPGIAINIVDLTIANDVEETDAVTWDLTFHKTVFIDEWLPKPDEVWRFTITTAVNLRTLYVQKVKN